MSANAFIRLAGRLPRRGSLASYAAAGAAVVAAALMKLGVDALWPSPPYVLFYPAIVIAATFAGPSAGVVAALAAFLLVLILQQQFGAGRYSSELGMFVFIVTGPFVGWLAGAARVALDGLAAAEKERDQAAREAVHRIKNLLAVVQAIGRQTARAAEAPGAFVEQFDRRLAALSRAQDLLLTRQELDIALPDLVDAALGPFRAHPALHVRPGPAVPAPRAFVSGLTMALYELCTNALKHGALSDRGGAATVSWSADEAGVVLSWDEETAGEPKIGAGFGATLIRAALSNAPGSSVVYDVAPLRVTAVFSWRA